jgi:hypothetical protein
MKRKPFLHRYDVFLNVIVDPDGSVITVFTTSMMRHYHLAVLEAIQFRHALDRILREILLADPKLGPIYLMKIDISDGFYRINLNVEDIPKLRVVFPMAPGQEPLVALTVTETIADIAN